MTNAAHSSLTFLFLPTNAIFLRGNLNGIADWSEKNSPLHKGAARVWALAIPFLALPHVPLYAARAVIGPLDHLAEGELKLAGLKLLKELGHTVQLLAFSVLSAVWALLSAFAPTSDLLTYWRAQLPEQVDYELLAKGLQTQLLTAQQQITQLEEQQNRLHSETTELQTTLQRKIDRLTTLESELQEKSGQLTTLNSEHTTANATIDRLQGEKKELTQDITVLKGKVIRKTEECKKLEEQLQTLTEKHSALEQAHAQKEQNFLQLTQELAKAKDQYQLIMEALKTTQAENEKQQLEQLKRENQTIESLETTINELRRKQEELEKALFNSFDLEIVQDLNKSSGPEGITPPSEQYEAFEDLLTPLLDNNEVWAICPFKGMLYISTTPSGSLDSFSSSVLTYMLIKGYQRLQNKGIEKEIFEKLCTQIKKIVSRYNEQKDLEFKVLKETIGSLDMGCESDLNPEKSIKSFIDTVLFETVPSERVLFHPFLRAETAINILSELFGQEIVHEVASYYLLSTNSYWTQRELAMLVIGIVANLDLQSAAHYLKTEDEPSLMAGIARLRRAAYVFSQNFTLATTSSVQQRQLEKDISLLDASIKVGDADETISETFGKHERYACIEYLARDLAYYLFDPAFTYYNLTGGGVTKFKEKMVVTIAGLNNQPRLYEIHTLIREGGVYGVTLAPASPKEGDEGIVLFRGTFDTASIARDMGFWERRTFEFGLEGPGGRSFEQNDRCKRILERWKDIKETTGIKKWVCAGHSLGGSDIARFAAAAVSKVPMEECEQLSLFTFNAPHVERVTNRSFIEGVQKYQCKFSVTHFEGAGDGVSMVGIRRIADSGSSIPNLRSAIWVFQQVIAEKKGPYSAHTSYWFTKGGDCTLRPVTV